MAGGGGWQDGAPGRIGTYVWIPENKTRYCHRDHRRHRRRRGPVPGGGRAGRYGSALIVAPRFYPSTKTCSAWGHIRDQMPLGDRVFRCEACSTGVVRLRGAPGDERAEVPRRVQVPVDPQPGRVRPMVGMGLTSGVAVVSACGHQRWSLPRGPLARCARARTLRNLARRVVVAVSHLLQEALPGAYPDMFRIWTTATTPQTRHPVRVDGERTGWRAAGRRCFGSEHLRLDDRGVGPTPRFPANRGMSGTDERGMVRPVGFEPTQTRLRRPVLYPG